MPASPHTQALRLGPGEPRSKGKRGLVKTLATRRQHAPAMHSNAEIFFVLPSPQRLEQKFSTQRPLVDPAGHRPKATHQTQKSERLVGSTLLRKPLEELRPSPKEQSVGPGPPPQKGTCWKLEHSLLVGRMRWGWWSLGWSYCSSLLLTYESFLVPSPGKLFALRNPLLPSAKCHLF